MKNVLVKLVLLLVSMSLVGCTNYPSKQNVGIATGAVAGGLIGSAVGSGGGQALAIGVGAVAGALIGGAIGKSMDDTDRMKMASALQNNPSGRSTHWMNVKTGDKYVVTPMHRMTVAGNPNCRKFRSLAIINGKKQHLHGIACRQADGTWRAV